MTLKLHSTVLKRQHSYLIPLLTAGGGKGRRLKERGKEGKRGEEGSGGAAHKSEKRNKEK